MPDGDIVHNRLRRVYQKPYIWLCEGKATSDECARAEWNTVGSRISADFSNQISNGQTLAEYLVTAQ